MVRPSVWDSPKLNCLDGLFQVYSSLFPESVKLVILQFCTKRLTQQRLWNQIPLFPSQGSWQFWTQDFKPHTVLHHGMTSTAPRFIHLVGSKLPVFQTCSYIRTYFILTLNQPISPPGSGATLGPVLPYLLDSFHLFRLVTCKKTVHLQE